jgi:hypothetical protein
VVFVINNTPFLVDCFEYTAFLAWIQEKSEAVAKGGTGTGPRRL